MKQKLKELQQERVRLLHQLYSAESTIEELTAKIEDLRVKLYENHRNILMLERENENT